MTGVVLASRNAKKVEELRRILRAAGIDLPVSSAADHPEVPEVAETGATFAENAALKAIAVAETTGLIAVADDSGLCVDALNGMPGVRSARWAGRYGDDPPAGSGGTVSAPAARRDAANLQLVLDQMADVPEERRGAEFRCAAAAARPGADGTEVLLREGEVRGRLLAEPRGTNGFGYDPIFLPDGFAETTAEMTSDQKDAISHRGKALRELASAMRTWWPVPPDSAR